MSKLDVPAAVKRAIEFSRASRRPVPLHQLARLIVIDTASEASALDSIARQLLAASAEAGLAIEFNRRAYLPIE